MPDNSNKFNKNIKVKVPEWLNEFYFEKILSKEYSDFKEIMKMTLIPATPPGENYTSILFRVEIDILMKDGFSKQKSFIVKSMLDDDRGGSYISMLKLFPREKLMYDKIIPQLEELYKVQGKEVKLAPKCFWTETENARITFVLEDLLFKKFKNINRLKGFDLKHMEKVLEKLAQFHAASCKWHEVHGDYPETFRRNLSALSKPKYYECRAQSYKEAIAKWGWYNHEKYSKKIPTAEEFQAASMYCYNTHSEDFKVLNHGDFWSNNIMLNYLNDGKDVNEIRFVDFQMCKWGSPAQDLWELIICSSESNIRIKHFDYFIRIYHQHLINYLKVLKYEKTLPTLKDIHISMIKYGAWGYFTTFTHLTLILLPPDFNANILNLIEPTEKGEEFRRKAFTNPLYVRAVLDIFPFLNKKGALDFQNYS